MVFLTSSKEKFIQTRFFFLKERNATLQSTYAAAAKSLQLCLTLCDPIDSSSPGSPIPGILQARTLEWGAISFSSVWRWKVKVKSLRRVRLLATPWTAAYQAPPSMGFSRQEYWNGVPLPSPQSTHSSESEVTQSCLMILCDPVYYSPPRLLYPWGFSRQEYWSGLPFPSPGGSSWPRDRTQVSCIAGRRFNLWATREALHIAVEKH